MTGIAVLSDIHGNLPALEAVVADAEARGCTQFANLGDILSGPLWPRETADYLMARDWPTIAGNHERQVLSDPPERTGPSDLFVRQHCTADQLSWLACLPETMELPGAWCTHARPGNDHKYLLETVTPAGARPATEGEIVQRLGSQRHALVLHGHSHLQKLVTLSDGRRIANPGSVGLPAYEDDSGGHHRMESGAPDARYLILERGEVTLLQVPYDCEGAAKRAGVNGRPDWAYSLRHGLVR
jgi:predicted phosphodiesterase